jgi:pimeloyl-ACP methyl ester carboxylesterase
VTPRFSRSSPAAPAAESTPALQPAEPPALDLEAREIELHGHRVIYRTAGSGPPLVLIHGMVNSSRHWADVAGRLAHDYRVIAPDLLGHGDSAKPEGDYSLGGHAAGIRDLLSALGIDRATIVVHSLGGGVAMQFFYQFPERCERLGLVSSGGLGREVSVPLKLAAMPGAGPVLALIARPGPLRALEAAGRALRARHKGFGAFLGAVVRSLRSLEEPGARLAFLYTLRSVIGTKGQRVSARDRLYLADLPTLVVWGERDRTIPIEHGREAAAAFPSCRFETLPGVGHFPHLEDPAPLAKILRDWVQTTEPARLDPADWRALVSRRRAAAAAGR